MTHCRPECQSSTRGTAPERQRVILEVPHGWRSRAHSSRLKSGKHIAPRVYVYHANTTSPTSRTRQHERAGHGVAELALEKPWNRWVTSGHRPAAVALPVPVRNRVLGVVDPSTESWRTADKSRLP